MGFGKQGCIFSKITPPRGGGKWKKLAMGKKMKKEEKRKKRKGKKGEKEEKKKEKRRKKGEKICPKKCLFKLNKVGKIWNLQFFFPIKPWKWPRGKNEGNKGGRRGRIGENRGEKFGICYFFPHQAFEMTKGENKGKKGGRMSGIA